MVAAANGGFSLEKTQKRRYLTDYTGILFHLCSAHSLYCGVTYYIINVWSYLSCKKKGCILLLLLSLALLDYSSPLVELLLRITHSYHDSFFKKISVLYKDHGFKSNYIEKSSSFEALNADLFIASIQQRMKLASYQFPPTLTSVKKDSFKASTALLKLGMILSLHTSSKSLHLQLL